jgi:cell division protein FtsB
MPWLMISRCTPYIVVVCLVFHYAYTLHRNDVLKQDNAVLSENIKQQQVVLDAIAARTEEQERAVSRLKGELEAKQYQDTTKVKKLLSRPAPSGCSDSMMYLKQEASGIVFE